MPIAILLILSLIGAIWTYRDARSRGMNAQAWLLIMLLTSMLALPVYLVMRKPKANA